MEKEIQVINKIIREAIINGADYGGSYESNEENLINAINEWLKMKSLVCQYTVVGLRLMVDGKYIKSFIDR